MHGRAMGGPNNLQVIFIFLITHCQDFPNELLHNCSLLEGSISVPVDRGCRLSCIRYS